jgi:hypothetical protein
LENFDAKAVVVAAAPRSSISLFPYIDTISGTNSVETVEPETVGVKRMIDDDA